MKKKNDKIRLERGAKISPGKYKNVGIKKTNEQARRPVPPQPVSPKNQE